MYTWKAVEKFEVKLQRVLLLLSEFESCKADKALRADACIVLLVCFSFHTRL